MSRGKNRNNKKGKFFKVLTIVWMLIFSVSSVFLLFSFLQSVFNASTIVSLLISILIVFVFALLILLNKWSRCIFLLMIPQFFSKRGRKALLTYVYFIALTGPTSNMRDNLFLLGRSLICAEVKTFVTLKES